MFGKPSRATMTTHRFTAFASTLVWSLFVFATIAAAQEAPAPSGPNIEPVDFTATAVAQAEPSASPSGSAWSHVVCSPDGKRVATVSLPDGGKSKGEIVIWNLADAKPVCRFEQTGRISAIAFSPDSSLLALGPDGPQAGVKLIDCAKGELRHTLLGPAAKTNCLAWSADGKRLALGSTFDKTVRLWDVVEKKFTKAHELELGIILAVAFAKDGTVLVAGTPQRERDSLVVLDAATGKPTQTLKGHKESIEAAAFSNDATVLTSAGYDATVRLWNLATGEETATLKGHKRGIRAVALSNAGKRLASANSREFKLWDGEKKESLGDLGAENAGAQSLALTHDGLWLIACSSDGRATVWDVEKKTEKTKLEQNPSAAVAATEPDVATSDKPPAPPTDAPEAEAIQSLAYSHDGKWLAVAREDGRISIRTAIDGKIHREIEAFGDVAACVAFSPNSELLAAGSFEKTIKIWKVAAGEPIAELTGHTNWVFSISFSPDGATLASASYDKTARLWNVAEAKEIAVLSGHTAGVRAVAFTRDGQHVISGGGDRSAIVWRLSDHQEVVRLKGHTAALRAIACSPDGTTVATASEDATIKLWKTADWTQRASLPGAEGVMFWCLAFSPQGRTLAAGAFDGTVKLFDPNEAKERATLRGPTDAITAVAFAPDAHEIIAGSIDKSFRRWTAQKVGVTTGETKAPELKAAEAVTALNANTLATEQPVSSLAFDKAGTRLAVGTGAYRVAGSLQLWDIAKREKKWQSEAFTYGLPGVQFTPDGGRIFVGNFADNFLKLFDATDGKKLKELRGHRSKVNGIAFSPNGKQFATASLDRDLKLWDATTLKEIKTFVGHQDYAFSVAFSPDGMKLLSGSSDRTARLWSIETGKELQQFKGHTAGIQQAVFSKDGLWIATAGGDGTARVCEAATGDYRFTLRGHRNKVESVAFSPNGKLIATASSDRTIRLWDSASGAELLKLSQEGTVRCVLFTPDGKHLASGGDDKTVKLWEVSTLSP